MPTIQRALAAFTAATAAGLRTVTVRKVDKTPTGIEVTDVVVRLFSGTPKDGSDDTVATWRTPS